MSCICLKPQRYLLLFVVNIIIIILFVHY